jgi:hypothetical protein
MQVALEALRLDELSVKLAGKAQAQFAARFAEDKDGGLQRHGSLPL